MRKIFIVWLSFVFVISCSMPTISFAIPYKSSSEAVFEEMLKSGTVDSLTLTGNMVLTKNHSLTNGEYVDLNGYSISNYKISLIGGSTYTKLFGGNGVIYSEVYANATTKLELSSIILDNFTTCSTGLRLNNNDEYTTPTVRLGANTIIKSKSLGLGSYIGQNVKVTDTQRIETTFYGGVYNGYSDSVKLQIVSVEGILGGTFKYCDCSGEKISGGNFEYCSIGNDISDGKFNNCTATGKITGGEFIGNITCSERSIYGGTFTSKPDEKYVAAGYRIEKNGEKYEVVQSEDPYVEISADKTEIEMGETVKLTITIKGSSFAGADYELIFDEEKFSAETPDSGAVLVNGKYKEICVADVGNGGLFSKDMVIGEYVFKAKTQTNAITSDFILQNVHIAKTQEEAVSGNIKSAVMNPVNGTMPISIKLKSANKLDELITINTEEDVNLESKTRSVTYDGNNHTFPEISCSVIDSEIIFSESLKGEYSSVIPQKTKSEIIRCITKYQLRDIMKHLE